MRVLAANPTTLVAFLASRGDRPRRRPNDGGQDAEEAIDLGICVLHRVEGDDGPAQTQEAPANARGGRPENRFDAIALALVEALHPYHARDALAIAVLQAVSFRRH